jgi:microsomal dipeptidase-like Zn-dependent dipeptidase
MKLKRMTSSLLACAAFISTGVQADSNTEAVHQLAQGCYAIQSGVNGEYLKKYTKGGAVDNGLSYHFENVDAESAAHFFFKPTSFNNYLITDKDGRYLASHLPAEISAGRYAGEFAEWTLSAEEAATETHSYSFHGNALNMTLRHNYSDGGLYFFDLLNPHNYTSESTFKLVAQNDCTDFPEVTTNVTGDLNGLKGNVNEPIRGWIDPHTHITSYEFMGGKFMAGEPFNRWGVEEALKDSSGLHGPDGSLDLIGNLYVEEDINFRYNTEGWPNFPYWPNHNSLSHMGYYYKWMERAYLSGLRMVTTALVENEVLCWAQSTINPASWVNPNSCNIMDSLRLQVQRMNEMEAYIDAQSGGAGKGWFRLVKSPEEARAVIADGKMAVLMGVEASETFDCGLKDECNRNTVEAKLNELYDLGVRTIYPTHKFDNELGGSRVENGFINIGQFLSSDRFFETKECDADTDGASFTSGFPLLGDIPFIKDILDLIGLNPQYDETIEHCNKHGLTGLGVYLVNRLIDKKMLIELDHLSADSATAVMDIVEARGYSGVITSHSWMNGGINGELHPNTKRLFQTGGFGSPYNGNANQMESKVSRYLDEIEQTPYLAAVGIGSDMSGLGGQAAPRSDSDVDPLQYPFTNEFGFTFEKQVSGNRVFDLNTDGIAHYGLLGDQIEDMRQRNSDRVYEAVMNSAEGYIQMWERAEASPHTKYYDPQENFVKIYNRKAQRCMDIDGHDNNLVNGANVQLWDCDDESYDQHWIWNKEAEMFENRADRTKCLDNRGQAHNEGGVVIWDCVDSDNLRWTYNMNTLASKHNSNIVADAYGYGNGDNVGQWEYNGRKWQEWELRPLSAIYKWVDWRDKNKGKCMTVVNGQSANGAKIELRSCNGSDAQTWLYNPDKGTMHSRLAGDYCLDVPAGNTANGTQLQIWQCQADNANQVFTKDGNRFSPQLNQNQAIDAAGTNSGDPILLWESHGGDNQKWRAGLH